jgi:ubiquitin C-terminal hydrolase
MKGIINLGNSCYLNAALQLLLQNIELCILIIKYGDYSEKLQIFKKIIREYYDKSSKDFINPIEVKKLIDERQIEFLDNRQNDSSEAIVFILDIIESELKILNKKDEYDSLFRINFNQKIKCKRKTCLSIINKNYNEEQLYLPVNPDCKSLDDCYNSNYCREMLDGKNQYFCDKCNKKTNASKKIELLSFSKNLIIGLNRYYYDKKSNNCIKINQDIDIPLEWKFNTILQGAIIHYGNTNGGHLIYIGKYNNIWYIYNDCNISEINSIDNLNNLLRKAYWLFYIKQ